MVIKRSSSGEVASLLHDLQTGDEVSRDTAVARLSVIGTRAVEGLIGVVTSQAPAPVRAAALGALEAIADPRAVDAAFGVLEEGEDLLSLPAAGVLRRALDSPKGTVVLDRLAAMALDAGRPDRARLAALEALQGLPPKVIAPIWKKLNDDPSPAVRGAVTGAGPMPEMDPVTALESAATAGLPEDPDSLRRWLSAESGRVALPVLHRLVESIRAREAATADGNARVAWMTARAAVHLALAERGSRVALYDLRETIESAAMAPVEMLSALEIVGDASCLEPIAAAYARLSPAPATADERPAADPTRSSWWRQHLATAFRAIAGREKLTERTAAVRRIRSRWPEAALDLLGTPKK